MATPVGTPTSAQGHSTTASAAHTVSAASNRVSYLVFVVNGGGGIASVASFGGVTPVLLISFNDMFVYEVKNPAAGATSASANLNADTIWGVHVITVQDVDQTTSSDTPQTNTSPENATSVSSPAITSAVGDLVIGMAAMVYTDIAAAEGSTLASEQESLDGSVISTAMVYEAGAASVVVGTTCSSPSFNDNAIIAWNVRNAAAALDTTVAWLRAS